MGTKITRTEDRCLDVLEWMQANSPTLDELSEYLGVGRDSTKSWLLDVRAVARNVGYRVGRPTYSNGWRYEVQADWVEVNEPTASATLSTLTALRDGMTRVGTQLADLIAVQSRMDGRTRVGKMADRAHVYLSAGRASLEDVEAIVKDLAGIPVMEDAEAPAVKESTA